MKKWIAGSLSVLALGGALYLAQPAVTYAEESQTVPQWTRGAGQAMRSVSGSMLEFIASLLGMDQASVIQERQAGESMVSIAESKGVSEETLISSVTEKRKEILAEQVQAGTISEAQAQFCEDNMDSRIQANLNRTEIGPNSAAAGSGLQQGAAFRGGRMGGQTGGLGRWQQAQ